MPCDMPLDHYVSQVHLKNFNSPALNGMIYAIRKSDLKCFQTRSQDICRIEDGSTNDFLQESRAIEDFLKKVEPRYNASLEKLRDNKCDQECIFCIAGFVAYVITCSPAAMRINSGPLKEVLTSTYTALDAQGIIPKAPESLDGKSITELLTDGTVKITVDPKYPQAMGITNIMHHVSVFGNSQWEIIKNDDVDNPFFTSDYPVAMEIININTPINRIVPLAPDIAIRIIPDINLSGMEPDHTFEKFKYITRKIKRHEVNNLNRLIVQCAEDLVLYRDNRSWVEGFVKKNRRFRIEPVTHTLKYGSGDLLVSTHRIRARPDEPSAVPK